MLVNTYKRSLQYPGFFGARVKEGLVGASSSAGMGDCLLVDLSRRFFAVADGSERNPSASRTFMEMFSTMLARTIDPPGQRVYGEREIRTLKRQLMAESDLLLQALSFGDSCTFTGILLIRTPGAMTGLLFHTGDSLLFACNTQTGESRQWSKNNFWMVGRTPHFFQVEDWPIVPQTSLLLATDGLAHIPLPPSQSREEAIRKLFETSGPSEIPDRLLETGEPMSSGWDDTAIIALDPWAGLIFSGCFLLGGTSQEEERTFQEERRQGLYPDRYLPFGGSGQELAGPVGV